MCGIVGALEFERRDFRISRSYLEAMRDTMGHRGPDGAGVWVHEQGRVGLAHRRLAIIDPTPEANQPMASDDGELQLIFNGELYNHVQLRNELEASGVRGWRTDHSDTEVLLRSYEQWGIDAVDRFRGMFAFAIWDGRERALWLVRDRLGVKPLYYTIHNGRLVFASEIKALLRDPDQPREIDEESLFHYLSFLVAPAPRTMFRGIYKLPAGTRLRVSENGSLREERYWDAWTGVEPRLGLARREHVAAVREYLSDSVALRKVSDVPVGVFLSGGVDSSANAVLFAQGETHAVRTFSIGYTGEHAGSPNELEFAREVARKVGSEHHELLLSVADIESFLPEMVRLQDEPIADPVCVPLYYVSQLARDNGVIVCQVGEGADELFAGYDHWHRLLRLSRIDARTGMRPLKRWAAAALAVAGAQGFRTERLARAGSGRPIFWGGAESFADHEKRALLSPRLRQEFATLSSWDAIAPIHDRFLANAWDTSVANWMTYVDLNLRLPELLLMRVDKMSMGASVECRVPFLDHELVQLALSIPAAERVDGGTPKQLLKDAVVDLVPQSVVRRPKQGFTVPVEDYFRVRLSEVATPALRTFCDQTDALDWSEVHRRVHGGSGWDGWYLLNLALWWHEHIAGPH